MYYRQNGMKLQNLIMNLKIYKDYETFEKIVKKFKIKNFDKKVNGDFIDKNNWKKRIKEYLKVLEMEQKC